MEDFQRSQRKAFNLREREDSINENKVELARSVIKREKAYQLADDRVLQMLGFPEISYRHIEIEKAHKETFAWLLKERQEDQLPVNRGGEGRIWHNFTKWLQGSGSLYWVNGKAGSGKSTLLRYIYDNLITRKLLEPWAGRARLQVVCFYSWNSGTKEQHSQTGLLRLLLYQVLKMRKDVIKIVLKEEWDHFEASQRHGDLSRKAWSFAQLERAFHQAMSLIGDECKICIFIDGLDEFEGDPGRLITWIKGISESPNTKF